MGRTRKVTTIVGEKNSGKSTFALALIQAYKHGMITIFDHQREELLAIYPEFENVVDILRQRQKVYRSTEYDWKQFTDLCLEAYQRREDPEDNREGHIIYEDLSAAITDQNAYPPLKNLLVSCRKKTCDVTMQFHQLWTIPPYIMNNTDELVLFKTGEHPEKGDSKRFRNGDRVLKAFNQVRNDPSPHAFRVVVLSGVEEIIY